MVAQLGGASAYYDGSRWVPDHGVIKTGTITIGAASTTGTDAHGLGANPGISSVTITPTSPLGTASEWRASTSTNFVQVDLDAAPGSGVTFSTPFEK